jgi:arsenical pump membrane protein
VLATAADAAGLFVAVGTLVSQRTRSSPRRLLLVVSAAAVVVTVLMSLDATAVLFTPVVIHVVRVRGARPARPLLATTQLANASSGFLPVSNLTNLLVFSATGLTFGGFALRMALPTAVASAVIVLVAMYRGDREPLPMPADDLRATLRLDGFAWFVVAALATLVLAFFVGSAAGIEPAWIAVGGATVVGVVALLAGRARPAGLVATTAPLFLLFVLGLAVVVQAAVDHGLRDVARALLPSGTGLAALLAVTAIAALLANAVNNVPATLLLVSVVPAGAVGTLLAVLVGVNIGPNLTYSGSLATLLRRVVRAAGVEPPRREFFRLALLATPLALVLATLILWLSLEGTGYPVPTAAGPKSSPASTGSCVPEPHPAV